MATITANTGSNNWNTNGAWVGGVQPDATSDVVIPASATVTIPTATTALSRSVTVQASGTLAFATTSSVLNIGDGTAGAGNVALSISTTATITLTAVGIIVFKSTNATVQTITSGGKTLPSLTFQGVGSKYQLSDALTIGTTATVTHTNGQVDLNGKTVSVGTYSITGSAARTLIFNGAALSCTAVGGVSSWNATTTTNLTFTPDTGSITVSGSGSAVGVLTFAGGALTYNSVIISGSFGILTITGVNTFATLTLTAGASVTNELRLANDQTVSGTFAHNGNSITNRLLVRSNTFGTTRTITAATVSTNGFVDFIDITAAGASSPWSDSGYGTQAVTNITGATPVTTYYVGGTGNSNDATKYASSDGGSANTQRAPLLQDTAIYNANSGSGTLTLASRRFGSINMANTSLTAVSYAGSLQEAFFGGDLILSANAPVTFSGFSDNLFFCGRGSHTLTTSGTTITLSSVIINCGVGTYTLGSDLTMPTLTLSQGSGTFTTNNYNISMLTYSGTGGTFNLGSSTLTLNASTAVTVWAAAVTLNAGTSTIVWANTTAFNQTFGGTSKTYYNLAIAGTGIGVCTITGTNTFNGMYMNTVGTKTIKFTSAVTTTLNTNTFFSGTPGNVITISSVTGGSAFTLTSPVTITTNYISLQDSTAAGAGNPFYAGANSTNVSGNTNWTFTDYPHSDGNNALMMGIG
jgi:hypothetical protein